MTKGNELKVNDDQDELIQLCCKVYYTMKTKPVFYQAVMNQSGDHATLGDDDLINCNVVLNVFQQCGITEISLNWIIDLLKKDIECGFAIMAPLSTRLEKESAVEVKETKQAKSEKLAADAGDEESDDDDYDDDVFDDSAVKGIHLSLIIDCHQSIKCIFYYKGYGVYPTLGLSNHSCMPTCMRADDVDNPSPKVPPAARRAIRLHALQPLAAGAEVTQSYVPLVWSLRERRSYLRQQ